MLTLNDREERQLLDYLRRMRQESERKEQTRHKVSNLCLKASSIIRKAQRRNAEALF